MRYPIESPKKAGAWLYDKGANVLSLDGKNPSPLTWKKNGWQDNRQDVEVVEQMPWHRDGVGVICGINGFRCLDVDGIEGEGVKFGAVEKILDALGLPHTYSWLVESGSREGYHIWLRCEDDDAFGGNDEWLPRREGAFDHLEVRWKDHQTAVPPTVHPGTGLEYKFHRKRPEGPPHEVTAQEVEEALQAVAKRDRSSPRTSTASDGHSDHTSPEVETIRSALKALPDRIGEGYNEWLDIIMAVGDGAPDDQTAKELLQEWRPEQEEGEYAEKLDSIDPREGHDAITVGTLFATAQNHGWTLPNSAKAAKKRVDKVIQQVEEGEAGAALIFKNLADFARLDTTDFAVAKDRISDAVNLNDFNQAVRQKRREVEREDFERQSERPTVQVSGRPGREVVDEAKEALHDWNDPPTLFQRGTEPAQIAVDDQGRPIIRELPEPVLDDRLDRAANFYRTTKKSGAVRADLSKRYVQRIRETIDLPPLDSIVEVPVLREDGSVLDEPGYDESSRLYYRPDESLDVPDVPHNPTREEIERAKETVWTPLQDFPFVDKASKANALALMLTPIVRPQLGAQNVPLAIVDATVQGTGKTLLVNVVSLTATGRTAATMNAPDGDEEWRKQITAQLLQGASMIVVDNVRGRLQSAPLEQALTTSLWQDRVLGKSQQVELPQRATWVATGNNVQPKGDMKRRVYPIRMDAEMERPWKGRDFSIDNLKKWTRENRGELVASLLTLARAWQSAGRPKPDVELLGSFEEWTRTVGGILQHAGVEGFLDNLETLYEQTDEETAEWAGFLESLYTYFHIENVQGNREDPSFTSKELGRLIQDSYNGRPDFRTEHMEEVLDYLPDYILQKLNRGDPISRTIGNMFAHRRGRRFGPEQWRVEVSTTKDRTKQWIVRGEPKKNESNESSNTPARENTPHPSCEGGGSSQKNDPQLDSVDSSEGVPNDEPPF